VAMSAASNIAADCTNLRRDIEVITG